MGGMMATKTFDCASELDGITYEITGTLIKPDGTAMVTIDRLTGDGSAVMFSTGWCENQQEAEEMASYILSLGDSEIMKLLKNDQLFPHIKAVMLKDKRVTLHLSNKVNIVTVKARARNEDDSYKAELHFTDRKKTAMLNEAQMLILIGIYGDDTDDWKGKPIVLYGEEGDWFGKHQWALRVDEGATYAAIKAEAKKAPKVESEPLPTFEKDIDESDLIDLDEIDEIDAEQTNLDLFGDSPSTGKPHNYSES
jgi:hypothetical protein